MPSYVIAGSSRGLGYEYLRQLSQDKSNVVVGLARNKKGVDERLAKDGITNVTILQADITDFSTLQTAANEVSKLVGDEGLDYLINNAVAYGDHQLKDLSFFEEKQEELKKALSVTFESNVIGVANTITAFIPLIKHSKIKKVIAISTGMADIDLINDFNVAISAPYAISKMAVSTLIAKYNVAYASQGILFMSISPGFVDTSEGKQMSQEELELVQPMIESFAKLKPGFTGPITPQESVDHVLKLVHRATVEEFGGKFVSHFGNKQWL